MNIEYVPFGEVFLEEKNAKWNTPYLFTSKELDRETGLYYYGARYMDPKLSIFLGVDPLAEKYKGWSSYAYALNNPVKFTDPTGMSADPPVGVDAEDGAIHTDSMGSWKYNKATTTWVGLENAKGEKSKDIGNTIELNNVNVQAYKKPSYFQGYYDTYKHIDGENPYSPYAPDGIGITLSGSVSYNYTTYSASFSLVADERAKIGGFFAFGSGVSTSRLGGGLGVSLDAYDTYGGATVFEGLKDYARGGSIGFKYLGLSHYQSVEPNGQGQFENASKGVEANSIFLNLNTKLSPVPSSGGSIGVTYTKKIF